MPYTHTHRDDNLCKLFIITGNYFMIKDNKFFETQKGSFLN